ncbi:hypothetical protein Tco_1292435 [Tanacetum coccineum]
MIPSCFLTNKTGAPQGDVLGRMKPRRYDHINVSVQGRCEWELHLLHKGRFRQTTVFRWRKQHRLYLLSKPWFVVVRVYVAIVGVAVVVVAAGAVVESSSVVKLSFVVTRWAYAFHQDKASSVKVPVANVTLFSSAHLLREFQLTTVYVSMWELLELDIVAALSL